MKKGDLIRNKSDGKYAVVMSTYTRFFQDSDYNGPHDYGVAGTAVEIKWTEDGQSHTFKKSKMKYNWEIVSEGQKWK